MRKWHWAVLAGLALVVAGGLVRAHGGLYRTGPDTSSASSSTGGCTTCPLQWLMSHCPFGR
jgi:hypothetical protein